MSGKGLKRIKRKFAKARTVKLKVGLSKKGLAALRKKGKLKIKLKVGFVPKTGHPTSKAVVTVIFKR